MTDDDYIIDQYEPHEHDFDPMRMICVHCGITAEAFTQGRDRPPTWEDVDEAFTDGRRIGIEIGQLLYKHNRRVKLIEVGYYLCLRRMSSSIEKDKENK